MDRPINPYGKNAWGTTQQEVKSGQKIKKENKENKNPKPKKRTRERKTNGTKAQNNKRHKNYSYLGVAST